MAVNEITHAAQGCAVQERYVHASGYRGTSLNLFDPKTARWRQLWVDNAGLVLRLQGGLDERGRMVLSGERTTRDGTRVRDRITWIPLTDGAVRQLWDVSRAVNEWENAFTGEYFPTAPVSGFLPVRFRGFGRFQEITWRSSSGRNRQRHRRLSPPQHEQRRVRRRHGKIEPE